MEEKASSKLGFFNSIPTAADRLRGPNKKIININQLPSIASLALSELVGYEDRP